MDKTSSTPQNNGHNSFTDRAFDKDTTTGEIEVIPTFPSFEIVNKVEEIPPLDILYSPKHRAMVKRQRKEEMKITIVSSHSW